MMNPFNLRSLIKTCGAIALGSMATSIILYLIHDNNPEAFLLYLGRGFLWTCVGTGTITIATQICLLARRTEHQPLNATPPVLNLENGLEPAALARVAPTPPHSNSQTYLYEPVTDESTESPKNQIVTP